MSVIVRDVEVCAPLPDIAGITASGSRADSAWLLVRASGEPLGFSIVDAPADPLAVAAAIERDFGPAIRRLPGSAGPLTPAGVSVAGGSPFLARRAEVLRDAPPITVVVCTRERPEGLARTLASLSTQDYPRFRVLVVDNAPTSGATARVARDSGVDYLVEPRPGLSRARNAAVAAAPGEILAFTDDDVVADRHWLAEVAVGFADHPGAAVVSGVIVPAELETAPQVWFERYGGHSKGRGFTPAVFSPATADRQSPLYPLPPFGAGANMVFRPGVIESIGGFDPALGAGTPAMGSEDTLAFTQVLRAGGTIVYRPAALVRHYHRRDIEGLRRQLVGYGTGLAAAYTSLVRRDPRVLVPLLRLLPTAARDVLGGGAHRFAALDPDFPRDLLRANRIGMLRGPSAYLAGRRPQRTRDGAT